MSLTGAIATRVRSALIPNLAALTGDVQTAICAAHAKAWVGATKARAEPHFVHMLALHAPPRLARAIQKYVGPATNVDVIGVLLHARPQVNVSGFTRGCELADLLVASTVLEFGGLEGLSSLLQVKKRRHFTKPAIGYIAAHDPVQFALYDRWPTFKVKTWSNVSPFTLGARNEQGLAGILDDAQCACAGKTPAHWGCEDFRSPGSTVPFSPYWADLLSLNRGREFFDPAPPKDDWSRLMIELLRTSATQLFAGQPRAQRSSSVAYIESDQISIVVADGSGRGDFVAPPESWSRSRDDGRGSGFIVTIYS